ncbi:MAG: hypothetical protein HY875_12850 [Chloroflexi bacterium]|nr:hypothetical protein [Chloroflexota bacterium]
MFNRFLVLGAIMATLAFAACGDDDSNDASPTPAASATAAATSPGTQPAATATKPAATATPTKAATPPADGTIDPLGAGQTTPWTVKALPETFTPPAILDDVRIGVHPEEGGWERIVFEFKGTNRPAAVIEYVNQAVACGSGQAVALPGTAVLQVRISQAAAHDEAGKPTIDSATVKGPGTTILQATGTCDFEGVVTVALGLKGKQNFKVTTLTNPTRIVVDVKQ